MDIIIRKLRPEDVDAVYAIECDCFASEAWARQDFADLAEEPEDEVFTALVAERGGEICGYICGSCVAGEMEICSVAVAKNHRRAGTARRLIAELERLTSPEKAFLEVRVSNLPARRLYGSIGFREFGIRMGYYDDPPEDALMMVKNYPDHS